MNGRVHTRPRVLFTFTFLSLPNRALLEVDSREVKCVIADNIVLQNWQESMRSLVIWLSG
jgi:hypothetical protein